METRKILICMEYQRKMNELSFKISKGKILSDVKRIIAGVILALTICFEITLYTSEVQPLVEEKEKIEELSSDFADKMYGEEFDKIENEMVLVGIMGFVFFAVLRIKATKDEKKINVLNEKKKTLNEMYKNELVQAGVMLQDEK